MPDTERRRHKLPARVTDAELEAIKARAAMAGLGLTAWIRKRLGVGR